MTSESRLNAKQILDQFYLEMRWRCLSLAADFDRVERAAGGRALLEGDPRIAKLREAVSLLLETGGANRAEKLQMIFSDKTPLKKLRVASLFGQSLAWVLLEKTLVPRLQLSSHEIHRSPHSLRQ